MNHNLWNSVAARVIAVTFVIAGVAACDRNHDMTAHSAAPSPSAKLIGVTPADPTGDPAGTSPVASNTTTVTKKEEIRDKPSEGDNHSYSSVAKDNPQKAEGKDPQQMPERAKQ
jgi:hypothetical protein